MALNPGNEETLVDGKGVEFLGKDKLAGNLVVNDGAGKEENKHSLNTYCMIPTSYVLLHLIPTNISEGWSTSLPSARKERTHTGKVTCPRSSCAHLSACKPPVLTSHCVAEPKQQGAA